MLRGDDGEIHIGAGSSVQDCSVLHTTPEHPTVVGDDCVIGHIVHLEGCTIEDGALVGNGAIVLHRVVVAPAPIVAANAVVLNDVEVPAGALAVGAPATIKPGRARADDIAARRPELRRTGRPLPPAAAPDRLTRPPSGGEQRVDLGSATASDGTAPTRVVASAPAAAANRAAARASAPSAIATANDAAEGIAGAGGVDRGDGEGLDAPSAGGRLDVDPGTARAS